VKAVSPYNFIPLNEEVVYSRWQWDAIPPFDKYDKDKLSGEIELTIETITPLYIRGMTKPSDPKDFKTPDFFNISGRPAIPSTSLRGLTKSLLEIISYGKFINFEDKNLFYRGLADMSSLGDEYRENMTSKEKKDGKEFTNFEFNAGYLEKKGFNYRIVPAEIGSNGKQFGQFKLSNSEQNFSFKFTPQNDGSHKVYSGPMPKKKRAWLINKANEKINPIPVPEKDIESYQLDMESKVQSKGKGNLLENFEGSVKRVPCFYVEWKDTKGKDRVSFGHTGYFRLAYTKSIGDHVPQKLKLEDKPDFTEALFGDEKHHASRVCFEDALIEGNYQDCLLPEKDLSILLSPKPTTFQHYLEQPNGSRTSKEKLKHWNSNTNIRGYKLYWHRNTPQTGEKGWSVLSKDNKKLENPAKVVKPGYLFKSKIRFENLTEEELGSLLFVLNLPENHYHKLGMGKPHGLGSVRTTTKLFVKEFNEKKNPYTALFNDNQWHISQVEKENVAYIDAFNQYVLDNIDEKAENIWQTKRLKELLNMLDWGNTKKDKWLEETRYMEIKHPDPKKIGKTKNEYKSRPVLPKPSEVIKG
jgi:CRISPR/Cas system CSM-associated protein Csm3 (group 7 of RAMP superfamily)